MVAIHPMLVVALVIIVFAVFCAALDEFLDWLGRK